MLCIKTVGHLQRRRRRSPTFSNIDTTPITMSIHIIMKILLWTKDISRGGGDDDREDIVSGHVTVVMFYWISSIQQSPLRAISIYWQWRAEALDFDVVASTFQRRWCHPVTVAQNGMLKPDLLALLITFYNRNNNITREPRPVKIHSLNGYRHRTKRLYNCFRKMHFTFLWKKKNYPIRLADLYY